MSLSTKIYHKNFSPIKSTFQFITQVILPFILGIAINIVFAFIFLGAWLKGAAWSESIYSVLFFILFLVGFPFLYFWLARKYVIVRGLSILYDNSKGILSGIIGQIVGAVVQGKEKLENNAAFTGGNLNGINDYLKKFTTDSDSKLKRALKFLLQRAPIFASLSEIGSTMELSANNLPQIQAKVQQDVDDFVKEELTGGSAIWLWLFFFVNAGLMYLAWQYFA